MGCTYSKKSAKFCSENLPSKAFNICERLEEYSSQRDVDAQSSLSKSISPTSHTPQLINLNMTESPFNYVTQHMLSSNDIYVSENEASNVNKTSLETEHIPFTVQLPTEFQTIFPTKDRKMEKLTEEKHKVLHPYWDQADHEYIIRNNIHNEQRYLNVLQERDETDDTLYEIPMRMPEVDFT